MGAAPLTLALQYGIGVPDGYVAFSPQEAENVAKKLSAYFSYKEGGTC